MDNLSLGEFDGIPPSAPGEAAAIAPVPVERSIDDLVAERAKLRAQMNATEVWLRDHPKARLAQLPGKLKTQLAAEVERVKSERERVKAALMTLNATIKQRDADAGDASFTWESRKNPRRMNPAELKLTIETQRRLLAHLNGLWRVELAYMRALERQADLDGLVSLADGGNDTASEVAFRGPNWTTPTETP